MKHVRDAEVSLQTGNAIVYYYKDEVSVSDMKKAVERAGFTVSGHSTPRQSEKDFTHADTGSPG